ncbi:MAG: TonB-dependent receptor [Alphaproteobacteria bacterium]|nr:TonB-dependent receptor [Alphaproteobacteria bacterium]
MPTGVTTPAASPQPDADQGGIADIVVTATRREERLQDVPVTVTAITGDALTAADISNVRTLNQIVPGFTGGRGGGAFFPVIRGVGSTGISVGDEPNVALYVDGVYQPDAVGNWVDLVEVERVEVLRGPQGTVFGRNATGGLVNVITPDPSFNFRGRVGARYGRLRNDAGDLDLRGYVTGPLSSTLAADLAVNYSHTEGYVKDLVRGSDNLGKDEVVNIRGKLLFKPSDTVKFVLTGSFMDRSGSPNVPQPYKNNTLGATFPGVILPTGPWQGSLTEDTVLDVRRYNASFQAQFEFEHFNLETTSGYSDLDFFQLGDSDSTNIFLESFPARLLSKSFSQEVRLLSNGSGRLQWIVGGYFFDLNGKSPFSLISRRPATGVTSRVFNSTLTTRSYSGFVEGTYEVASDLFFTAGGRYTTEDRTFRQVLNGRDVFGKVKSTFDKWTYRGALRYNFAKDANIYASYGTGFKSGVYNMSGLSPVPVKPENIKAAEVGIKADPADWLRTNLAIFHYDYKDLQVQAKDTAGPGYLLQNAATAEIYGGELELTAQATPDLMLRGSVAYLHAQYDKFAAAQSFIPLPVGGNTVVTADASGKQLGRAPKWTVNVGAEWGHDLAGGRFGASTNVFYSSKVFYDFQNVFFQPSYVLWNAQLSWTTADERWRFTLSGTNLTNEQVYQQIRPSNVGTDAFYEMPRRVTIGAEMLF